MINVIEFQEHQQFTRRFTDPDGNGDKTDYQNKVSWISIYLVALDHVA